MLQSDSYRSQKSKFEKHQLDCTQERFKFKMSIDMVKGEKGSMSEDTARDHVKVPTFDGRDKSWPFHKKKMESHLARMDLSELLSVNSPAIPRDDAADANAKEQEKTDELRKKNRKAAGVLLNSITCDDVKGQAAFHLTERHHNAADGYAGGCFKKEWEALIAMCDMQQEHFQHMNHQASTVDSPLSTMTKVAAPALKPSDCGTLISAKQTLQCHNGPFE